MKKKTKKKKVLCPAYTEDVPLMTADQTRELLLDLMTKLDVLDMEDGFGTEGWRKFLGYGD